MEGGRSNQQGLRGRISQRGEDALGEVAQTLLENPLFNQALQTAFTARDRAMQAQQAAMGALNLPSASDVERLTRRLRSLSERLEGLETGIDLLERKVSEVRSKPAATRKPAARKASAKKAPAKKAPAKKAPARKAAAKKAPARKSSGARSKGAKRSS